MKATKKNAYTWRWVQARHKKSLARRQKDEAEMLARYEIITTFLLLFLCCFLPLTFLAIVAAVGLFGIGGVWVYFHYFDIDRIIEDYTETYTPVEWLPRQQRPEPKPEVRPEAKEKGITYHEPLTNTFYFDGWKEDNQ